MHFVIVDVVYFSTLFTICFVSPVLYYQYENILHYMVIQIGSNKIKYKLCIKPCNDLCRSDLGVAPSATTKWP